MKSEQHTYILLLKYAREHYHTRKYAGYSTFIAAGRRYMMSDDE